MIETVRIVKANRSGYATINKSDYDPAKHELFGVVKPDTAALVDEALALGVLGPNGKPASRSVLERWKYERLVEAIAEINPAEAKA